MFNRRRLARERLEIYLVHLILTYRWLFFLVGLCLLVYAVVMMMAFSTAGIATLLPAIFLLALGSSFNIAVYTARLGAWIVTLWK